MKLPLALISCALFATAPVGALEPVPGIYGTGRWRGQEYAVSPSSSHLMATKWNPEREECPLSVPRAVGVARESLKKMVGVDAALFRCDELKLTQENGFWFYVVSFYSEHPRVARKGDVGIIPAILPFIVHLDGFPELPFQKKA